MNILIADDHLMTVEGYISILNNASHTYYKAQSCETCYTQLMELNQLDVAILDQDMPAYTAKKIESGLDCALLIRQRFPSCKIILITAHEEALILYTLYQQRTLDALLVKSDFTSELLHTLVNEDKEIEPFYSPVAKVAIRKVIAKTTLLDAKNREILMYLSHGYKIPELESFVFLSPSTIQKRISKMIHEFQVTDYQQLIQILKQQQLL